MSGIVMPELSFCAASGRLVAIAASDRRTVRDVRVLMRALGYYRAGDIGTS